MRPSSPTDSALEVRSLAKRFGAGRGVEDVTLTVPAGSITAFIGANGAGKSTTFRCVLGLMRPDAGEVRLFGRPADAAARRRVGFLPEERGLAPNDRVRDAIVFHARLKGLARRDAARRAESLLARMGLGGRGSERIEALSKGNAQRVQLICALAHAPDLLILDEPMSGLDPVTQSDMLALFAEIRAAGGAILFSTHSMAAAEALCDRVVMLSGGRTVFEGPLAAAAERAAHGAVVVTTDPRALAEAAEGVGGEVRPMTVADGAGEIGESGARRWRVRLPAHVPHPALLRALSERGVPVLAFTPIRADLEGAFWDLARPSAAPAATVERAA
ncbi:MAG TPA: ATP-binding cassette domain-containing protein [Caulobacteraceae bacterium]|nr:ATP-binding cassette domain-containing protein [Caulobacteraceae bacterium]